MNTQILRYARNHDGELPFMELPELLEDEAGYQNNPTRLMLIQDIILLSINRNMTRTARHLNSASEEQLRFYATLLFWIMASCGISFFILVEFIEQWF